MLCRLGGRALAFHLSGQRVAGRRPRLKQEASEIQGGAGKVDAEAVAVVIDNDGCGAKPGIQRNGPEILIELVGCLGPGAARERHAVGVIRPDTRVQSHAPGESGTRDYANPVGSRRARVSLGTLWPGGTRRPLLVP